MRAEISRKHPGLEAADLSSTLCVTLDQLVGRGAFFSLSLFPTTRSPIVFPPLVPFASSSSPSY